ncbi:gene transfer agent protein [Rhodobacter phage RcCWillis]|nr:gene transfer agent protein [Rhodobacter phage RcCWillis]
MAIQFIPILISVLIGFAIQVVGYLLMGQPKQEKTDDVKDLETPTAEAGRPIPVPFGELEIKGLNCLWFGEKSSAQVEVGGGGKK